MTARDPNRKINYSKSFEAEIQQFTRSISFTKMSWLISTMNVKVSNDKYLGTVLKNYAHKGRLSIEKKM